MINPHELRIGNLVYTKTGKEIKLPVEIPFKILELQAFKVSAVKFPDQPYENEEWPEFIYNDLAPIPITDGWLKRMGFVNGFISPFYHTKIQVAPHQTAIQGRLSGEWTVTLMDIKPHSLGKVFKYVHQLQNLIFDLTDEQLI